MPFQKGQSGNPAGRPPGSRNRATLFADALLEGEAEMIIRNAIRAAVNDVPWAVRLCFDRLSPRLRSRAAPIAFELPPIRTLADIPPAIAKISSALAAGDITIDEAERYTTDRMRRERLAALESLRARMLDHDGTDQVVSVADQRPVRDETGRRR